MAQSALQSLSASNPQAYAQTVESITLTASSASPDYLINPWMGLIGLAVLVISGAVAVVREILIEEEDQV